MHHSLPPKTDKLQRSAYVRFVPKADICSAANYILFDHLVGAGHGDDQLELARLHDRQVRNVSQAARRNAAAFSASPCVRRQKPRASVNRARSLTKNAARRSCRSGP
jgi:hypothetical protein